MIKLWKFFPVLISLAVCLGLLLVPAAMGVSAAEPASGKVGFRMPAEVKVAKGATFEVNVTIYNPHGVNMCIGVAAIRWDVASLLTVNDITLGDWPVEVYRWIGVGEFEYDAGCIPVDKIRNTTIVHCTVNFTANATTEGTTTVRFVTDAGEWGDIPSEVYDDSPQPQNVLDWAAVQNMTVIIGTPKLTVDVSPAGKGDVKVAEVIPSAYPNITNWNWDEVVNLEAVNSVPGYTFDHWSGDLSGSATPTSINMDANKTVTANFLINQYNLTIDSTAGGSVTTPGEAIFGPYDYGMVVNLTATPDADYSFVNWSGDVGTIADVNSATTSITMYGDYCIMAHFGPHDFSAVPASLNFTANVGENPPGQMLELCNTGNGTLNWSLTDNAGWLSETPTSGSLSEAECEDITVSVNTSGMEVGLYSANITITGSANVIIPVTLEIKASIDVMRNLPDVVERGETFNVTVNFTAPADEFNAISLTDLAPDGWNVTVDEVWCTPNAYAVLATGSRAEIAWYGPYDKGTNFIGKYKVTVPDDAPAGIHTFNGFLGYFIGGSDQFFENVTGDSETEVIVPTLAGHVSFYRTAGPGDPTWETPLVVEFFDNSTKAPMGWSPRYATTDAYGNFTVADVEIGTYDIGIKNCTTLSKMVYGKAFTAGNTTEVNFGTLLEADCDDNDKTDGSDYAKVLNNYNVRKIADPTFWATNELWKADYTRDDKIDGSDYASMLNNYGERGDKYDER